MTRLPFLAFLWAPSPEPCALMCLVALAWRQHPTIELIVVANRDEFHERATAPAAVAEDHPQVFGGFDRVAGGSWLQIHAGGRLCAVTNIRFGPQAPVRPRSRGALVREFVRSSLNAEDFVAVCRVNAMAVGPFNLIAWDGEQLWFARNHPDFAARPLEPGIYGISNGELNAPWPKSDALRAALGDWLRRTAGSNIDALSLTPLFTALREPRCYPDAVLPDTGVGLDLERLLSAAFIEGERYGTRASTVVLFGRDGSVRFEERRFAPGGAPTGASNWHRPAGLQQ